MDFTMLVANYWGNLSFCYILLILPLKSLETEFLETKEALEGQTSAKQLLFELFKKSLCGKVVQQPCR